MYEIVNFYQFYQGLNGLIKCSYMCICICFLIIGQRDLMDLEDRVNYEK